MKRAYEAFWWEDPTAPSALHLTADFCAEHELGIGTLRSEFGIPDLTGDVVGIERHRIRVLPPDLIWYRKGTSRYAFLRFDRFNFREPTIRGRELWIGRNQDTAGAWSGQAFQIVAQTPQSRKNLSDLRDAFVAQDVAILTGGGSDNPFHRPGLTFGIMSRVPSKVDEALREHDLDQLALREAADKSEIRARFDAARIQVRSLFPRWAHERKPELEWYVSLRNSDALPRGWYSTDDLNRWLDSQAI